jgi:hypothetical protein
MRKRPSAGDMRAMRADPALSRRRPQFSLDPLGVGPRPMADGHRCLGCHRVPESVKAPPVTGTNSQS